jgi:peptidyl-tRNA hydrolase
MSPGKTASQAGHAYLGAFIEASRKTPDAIAVYSSEHPTPGTKVCLKGNLNTLRRAQEETQKAGIPHCLIVDSGCTNFFNGEPTVTALGFGPATEEQLTPFMRRLQVL